MELKVRVDGIQRVVCGVDHNTTCQDVIVALAQATSQVGRFTLIEKFRSNERFLSPGEKPVQVLSKWGEYANDVQFVLKRTCDTLGNNQLLTDQSCNQRHKHCMRNNNNQRLVKRNGGSEELTSTPVPVNTDPAVREKSSESDRLSHKTQASDCLSRDNVTSASHSESGENGTHSQRDGRNVHGLISMRPDDLSHHRLHQHQEQQSLHQLQSLTRPKHPPSYESVTRNIIHQSNSSPAKKRSSQDTTAAVIPVPTRNANSEDEFHEFSEKNSSNSREKSRRQNSSQPFVESNIPEDPLPVVHHKNSSHRFERECVPNFSSRDADHEEEEQEKAADRSTTQTNCWEADLQEIRIREEYDRKKLEKDQLLLKASGLEAEIAVCRQKIQLLKDQIREEEHRIELEQRQRDLMPPAAGRESIESLERQISECEQDLHRQKHECEEVQSELKEVDQQLRLKYEEMENVMKEIRKENLNALSLEVPASSLLTNSTLNSTVSPFTKLHSEVMRHNHSASLLGSRFYNRIGSTRKMLTSPHELRSAVTSNKNPQGVWV